MPISRTLLGTITDRATVTFTEVNLKDKEAFKAWYNDESWNRWYDHWIATGEIIYNEFIAEGLVETAAIIRKHIDFTISIRPKKL